MMHDPSGSPLEALLRLAEDIVGEVVKYLLIELEGIAVVIDFIDGIEGTAGIALLEAADGVLDMREVLPYRLLWEEDGILPVEAHEGVLGLSEGLHQDLRALSGA